uniref:Uncharacterized protein n=1 Tax=Arabidopsis thaliana TaxID=3702 RepID=Q56YC2_ARATH|nr:hypothetical protein [Arabidopsis thaliana]
MEMERAIDGERERDLGIVLLLLLLLKEEVFYCNGYIQTPKTRLVLVFPHYTC